MKGFEEYTEEVLEESIASSIRDELNKLQHYWNQNAKQFLKQGLYPIFARPFSVKKNGILVIGLNPGGSKQEQDLRDKMLSLYKNNQVEPVYDASKKEWMLTYSRKGDLVKGRVVSKELKDSMELFDTLEYSKSDKRPSYTSKKGRWLFHANLNKMLEGIGQEKLIPKLYACNWIPFPSKGQSSIKPLNVILKTCAPWVSSFIQLTKPKAIICPIGIFNLMKSYMGVVEYDEPIYVLKSGTHEKTSVKYMRTGMMGSTPVIAFVHWTGSMQGGPTKTTFKDDKTREAIAAKFAAALEK